MKLLDSNGRTISAKKFPSNMFIKTIPSKGGTSQIIKLPEVPIVGSFNIPSDYDLKDLKIKVEGLVKEELESLDTIEPEGIHLGTTTLK